MFMHMSKSMDISMNIKNPHGYEDGDGQGYEYGHGWLGCF
jgi:hypothetical protein